MNIMRIALAIIFISFLPSVTFSDELATRKEIESNVKSLFMSEQFHELDFIAEQYRTEEERTSSGLWKLTIFYYGFNRFATENIKNEEYWEAINKIADKWIKESPNSPSALIAKGIILKQYAWKFRGVSFSNEVPIDAWKPFKENLRIAYKHMLDNKRIASNDPHWYELTARILTGLNVDGDTFEKLINQGIDKYPNYYQLYFASMDYYSPKWHGNDLKIEKFANSSAKRTQSTEGMGMYARIYWYAYKSQYGARLFIDSELDWEKMRKGFFDVIETYPDSWNIQNFAFFSCLAKDKETTWMLLNKMNGPVINRAWKKLEYYDYCRAFSKPTTPKNAL